MSDSYSAWARAIKLPPDLQDLPPVVDLVTAARLAGVTSRGTAYQLARTGGLPFPVMRVGKAWRVSRHELLKALGYDVTGSAA